MSTYHLAQLNIARAKAPLTDPVMADFTAQLDTINGLGERSPGFVWRWTDAVPIWLDPRLLVNLTVWTSIETLADFTYRSDHAQVYKRRKIWFEPMDVPHMVLWWVPEGHRPDLPEAFDRLTRFDLDGPTAKAFTFRTPHPPPG